MSDWQQDMHDFNEGFTNSAQSRQPWNKLNQSMQAGRAAAGHDSADAAPSSSGGRGGRILTGLGSVAGLAGLVIGLLLGANFLDEGWIALPIMLGSAALGLIIGAGPFLLLQLGIDKIYEGHLWRKQGKENTADKLVQFWNQKYGAPPLPELLEAMDDNGAAWVMTRKGEFILRMSNGNKLHLVDEYGAEGEIDALVQSLGRGFDLEDANNMILALRSLGHTSITLKDMNKKNVRLVWVAAGLADIDVDGYKPDRKAHQLMMELGGDSQAPEGTA